MTATPIRYAGLGYGTATQDGSGNWIYPVPTSNAEGEWGTFRIEAGAVWDVTGTATLTTAGTAITTVNDVPTIIDSLGFGDFGETVGQITLPELSPSDDPAAIGVYPGGNIDIYRVLPTAQGTAVGVTEIPYWHGIVASMELSDGAGLSSSWSLQLTGALYGETSVRAHQPIMLDTEADVGQWANYCLRPTSYSRPFAPWTRFSFESTTTGIDTRYRGSRGQSVIDYLDELMGMAQSIADGQWQIARAYQTITGAGGSIDAPRARHYYIREIATNMAAGIQQNTVFAGGYGVNLALTSDATEVPTAIYGEGVHPTTSGDLSGSRWRNAVYPMLTTSAPANPSRVSGSTYPIVITDTDADFTTDVITQASSQLRMGGWPDVTITSTFDADMQTAIVAAKEDTGYANTNANIGGTAEWAWLFATGSGYTDLASGYMLPLHDANPYFDYAVDGDVVGTATGYDGTLLRVERAIAYGEGISKNRARINARKVLTTASDVWTGTITLMTDPTDESAAGRSRLDIREGSWVQVNNLDSGTYRQFYVSAVTHQPESPGFPTQLQVSTVPYAQLDLAARLERNKAAKADPARSYYNQRTQVVRPWRSVVGWDAESGAGIVSPFSATGSQWTVKPVILAQYGSIGALSVDVGASVDYCFAVFGSTAVAGTALDALISAPMGSVAGGYASVWQHPDNIDQLASWGFIEAWGSVGEAAGWYPGNESAGTANAAGSAATGKTEDAGSWTFASLDPPWGSVAIWPRSSVTKATVKMKIVVEE